MKRKLIIASIVLVALFLLVPEFVFGPVDAALMIVFGWIPSALRLVSACQASFGPIALFIFAAVVMVAGTHSFLRWICANLRRRAESIEPLQWRWKWTLCGYGVLVCTLVAISSAILTTHQVYWLAKSTDPYLADYANERIGVLELSSYLKKAAVDSQWNIDETRHSLLQKQFSLYAPEQVDLVWIAKKDRSLEAAIVIPRHPLIRARARIAVVQNGKDPKTYMLDQLPNVLASFGVSNAKSKSN